MMVLYKQIYHSPLGDLSLVANNQGLIGVWFLNQKYFEQGLEGETVIEQANTILIKPNSG